MATTREVGGYRHRDAVNRAKRLNQSAGEAIRLVLSGKYSEKVSVVYLGRALGHLHEQHGALDELDEIGREAKRERAA